jgi:hypothetical protein
MGKYRLSVADPELEEIAKNVECFDRPSQFSKELDQEPIVIIFWISQVCIGNKYPSHARTILKNSLKVKVHAGKGFCSYESEEKSIMGFMHDVEIEWDDLLDAFSNVDPETVFYLDRETGEVFSILIDYEDDDFWEDIEANDERYLQIPDFDQDQERQLLHEFIKELANGSLKSMLERSFAGKHPCGRLDDILSFYPEETERLIALRDEMITNRIRSWLELNDIFLSDNQGGDAF